MNIANHNGQGSEGVMYLRVSTPEQADPLNLKNQEDACRRLATQRGIAVAEVILGLKAVCRAGTKVPAARCNVGNLASRRTLQRSGFVPCGNIVAGDLA